MGLGRYLGGIVPLLSALFLIGGCGAETGHKQERAAQPVVEGRMQGNQRRDVVEYFDMVYLGACLDTDRNAVMDRLNERDIVFLASGSTGATTIMVPRTDLTLARSAIETDPRRRSYDFTFGD